MLTIKRHYLDSWLDPIGARRRAAELADHLTQRLKGRRCLFVTLTYDRSGYDSPQALYRDAADAQHVPLFLRRLFRATGINLKGRWLRKMEFQAGGWLHYHLILDTARFIPAVAVRKAWGHGFVSVKRVYDASDCARYTSKTSVTGYVSKDQSVPPFLLERAARAVKVVAVSPGFWRRPKEPARVLPDRSLQRLDAWVPMRFKLEQARYQTRLTFERHDGSKLCRTVKAPPLVVMAALDELEAEYYRGFILVPWDRSPAQLLHFIDEIACWMVGQQGAPPGPPAFNLIQTGNPDALPNTEYDMLEWQHFSGHFDSEAA